MGAARVEWKMVITSAVPPDQKVVKQMNTVLSNGQYVWLGWRPRVVPKLKFELPLENGDRTIDLSVFPKVACKDKLLFGFL
ncbi:ATP synthase F0 subcomplex subunit OSCP atp5 [Elasticomyces elasticus]|nr:ATP synthase F0 subcomplex subunit OSCP atp5 [Elasticomyces elasticus]